MIGIIINYVPLIVNDYLNLGAGAEIGIYSRPNDMIFNPKALDHYFVDYDLAMPMQLYLYECNGQDIDNVFSWNPNDKQWWITGWNPEYVDKVDVKKMVSVGCIDFSGYEDLYNELKANTNLNSTISKYMIFDDRSVKAWLCWDGVN